MKRIISAVCIVICIGLIARTWAQDNVPAADQAASDDYFKIQGDVMKCSPPKFLLIADVDLEAQTLTGLSTIQRHTPQPVVTAYHMTFKLSDIKVTNARRKTIDENDLKELKGKLVVMSKGKEPLSAVYLGLFREDTIVISITAAKE